MFTLTTEPVDAEHWLRILEQKFQLLTVTEEQKVCFTAQQLLGSASAWWDMFNAMQPMDHHVTWQEFNAAFQRVLHSCWCAKQEVDGVSRPEAREHVYDGLCEQVRPSSIVC